MKEDKKKKEKKPGMLSGLFKRKDKKSKNLDDDVDDPLSHEKHSGESSRSSPVPKGSEESLRTETQSPPKLQPTNKDHPNKLQKRSRSDSASKESKTSPRSALVHKTSHQLMTPDRPAQSATASLRSAHSPEPDIVPKNVKESQVDRPSSSGGPRLDHPPAVESRISDGARSTPPPTRDPPSVPLSSEDSRRQEKQPQEEPERGQPSRPTPEVSPDRAANAFGKDAVDRYDARAIDRLSESPVQITAEGAARPHPAGAGNDFSSQDTADLAPSPPSSPEMVDAPEMHEPKGGDEIAREPTPVSSTATQTWSDASLRTYLENDNDIKDLLIVVHDKSGVVPAGPDHPVVGGLFKKEQAKLSEITSVSD